MVEAVSGEGRIGRVGLDSTLKDLISETGSAWPLALAAAWWCARARKGDDAGGAEERPRLMAIVTAILLAAVSVLQKSLNPGSQKALPEYSSLSPHQVWRGPGKQGVSFNTG
jgi:hypothetical protein